MLKLYPRFVLCALGLIAVSACSHPAQARRVSIPLSVTANQTPVGRDALVDSSYAGVAFSGVPSPLNTWTVRHENGAAMANSSSFNIWAPANIPLSPADSIRDRERVIR